MINRIKGITTSGVVNNTRIFISDLVTFIFMTKTGVKHILLACQQHKKFVNDFTDVTGYF